MRKCKSLSFDPKIVVTSLPNYYVHVWTSNKTGHTVMPNFSEPVPRLNGTKLTALIATRKTDSCQCFGRSVLSARTSARVGQLRISRKFVDTKMKHYYYLISVISLFRSIYCYILRNSINHHIWRSVIKNGQTILSTWIYELQDNIYFRYNATVYHGRAKY